MATRVSGRTVTVTGDRRGVRNFDGVKGLIRPRMINGAVANGGNWPIQGDQSDGSVDRPRITSR